MKIPIDTQIVIEDLDGAPAMEPANSWSRDMIKITLGRVISRILAAEHKDNIDPERAEGLARDIAAATRDGKPYEFAQHDFTVVKEAVEKSRGVYSPLVVGNAKRLLREAREAAEKKK